MTRTKETAEMSPLLRAIAVSVLLGAGCASSGTTVSKPPVSDSTSKSANPVATPVESDPDAPPVGHVRLGVHCVKGRAGVRVTAIEAESLAQESGLRAGDVILKYGNRVITEVSDLTAAINATSRGAEVAITVSRGTSEEIVVVQY
jgi:S1-C subfamily serine protease